MEDSTGLHLIEKKSAVSRTKITSNLEEISNVFLLLLTNR